MQSVPRWRTLLILRNSTHFSSTQFASFHSTHICNDKSKKKWNSDVKRGPQAPKNYTRFVIREKRADAKRALRSLLFNCKDLGAALQNVERTCERDTDDKSNSNNSSKKGRSESRRAQKIHGHRMRRKLRKRTLSEDDDDYPENMFHATFGDRSYTWSFNPWTRHSQSSRNGFDWRDSFRFTKDEQEEEDSRETQYEYQALTIGSRSDRATLGLPLKGPLKKEDVKNAFHSSALKWHPDKHQGPSQAAAEEKFKLCANAYKSLCSALTSA